MYQSSRNVWSRLPRPGSRAQDFRTKPPATPAPAKAIRRVNPYDFGNRISVPAHVELIRGRWEVVRDDGRPLTYFTHS